MVITPTFSSEDLHPLNTSSHNHRFIMENLLKGSSTYLFAFTIEHSLICAVVVYVMWKNISQESQNRKIHYKREKTDQTVKNSNYTPYKRTSSVQGYTTGPGQRYT